MGEWGNEGMREWGNGGMGEWGMATAFGGSPCGRGVIARSAASVAPASPLRDHEPIQHSLDPISSPNHILTIGRYPELELRRDRQLKCELTCRGIRHLQIVNELAIAPSAAAFRDVAADRDRPSA